MLHDPTVPLPTRCDHDEAKLDPIVRAETCYFVGVQVIREVGCLLALFNCCYCGSTLAVPLPGHQDDSRPRCVRFDEPTAVRDVAAPLPRRVLDRQDEVRSRPGFVPAEAQ